MHDLDFPMRPIDFHGRVRIVIFSAAVVLFVLCIRQELYERMAFARWGRQAVATVLEPAEMVARPRDVQYAHPIEYDGRKAKLELSSPLPVGSHLAIEYVARPRRDLVRTLPAGWPWGTLFLMVVTPALAMAVVQEFRGLSWWRPVLIVFWRRQPQTDYQSR